MSDILILADDLTGAADTAAQFARLGYSTLLLLSPESFSDVSVLVVTSESRGLSAGEAAAAVLSVLSDVSKHQTLNQFKLIYKKIDSTLRGNPAAELDALLKMSAEQCVLVAPAYPAQGRTTQNGVVWVHNQPLAQTQFAAEAGSGDLRLLFGDGTTLLPLSAVRQGAAALKTILHDQHGLILADAETDKDLLALAQAAVAEGIRVFCGSAGLAAALTHLQRSDSPIIQFPNSPQLSLGTSEKPQVILAVSGSLHAASISQVVFAQQHGFEVITPPMAFFRDFGDAGIEETGLRLASFYEQRIPVILNTVSERVQLNRLPNGKIAEKLARAAAFSFPQNVPAGLLLTGGDTALAICRALNCKQLWVGGEIEAGIPWSRSGRLTIVTKAGGFGSKDAILNGLNWIKKR